MIKEVIVVEGKSDVVAISRALEADCLITGGFGLSKRAMNDIKAAYEKRGIIILTDPDGAGERIRRHLEKRFPKAKHAYVPRDEATNPADGDVGIEDASPESIRKALEKVHTPIEFEEEIFSSTDLIVNNLSGAAEASARRAKLGAALGLGYANAKVFLKRLNHYGITREEFEQAVAEL